MAQFSDLHEMFRGLTCLVATFMFAILILLAASVTLLCLWLAK